MSDLINALQDCLQRMEQGKEFEGCLQRYPGLAKDLRPLLESAARVQALSSHDTLAQAQIAAMEARVLTQVRPASSSRWFSRNMLMSAAAALMLVIGLLVITNLLKESDLLIEELPPTQDKSENEIVITGSVEKLRFDAIVVEGITIDPAGIFNPADLSLGDYVTVTGISLSDNTLQATYFELVYDRNAMPQEQDNSETVVICHAPPGNPGNARTITVAGSALNAHLAHGDSEGPCSE